MGTWRLVREIDIDTDSDTSSPVYFVTQLKIFIRLSSKAIFAIQEKLFYRVTTVICVQIVRAISSGYIYLDSAGRINVDVEFDLCKGVTVNQDLSLSVHIIW